MTGFHECDTETEESISLKSLESLPYGRSPRGIFFGSHGSLAVFQGDVARFRGVSRDEKESSLNRRRADPTYNSRCGSRLGHVPHAK